MKRALFIAGPTASGKSALALKIAERDGGVIINADSMQVYRDLPVLTACPTMAEQMRIPHRLYGFMDGAEVCSAAFWAETAMAEMESAWLSNKLPILVGGTGMYFKVLLDGIAKIPEIPKEIRTAVRSECTKYGSDLMHARLVEADPVTAKRIAPGDSQRISRAIEVYRATGVPLSVWHKDTQPGPMAELDRQGRIEKHVIMPEREELYHRCNKRFDLMIDAGVVAEIETLGARNLSPELPIMRALGVPSLLAYLSGGLSLQAASEEAKMQTRRFAKRQLTWLRNQFSDWLLNNTQ